MVAYSCSVCRDTVPCSSSSCCALSCGHVFHQACADTWLATSPCCPLCRVRVPARPGPLRLFFSSEDSTLDCSISAGGSDSAAELRVRLDELSGRLRSEQELREAAELRLAASDAELILARQERVRLEKRLDIADLQVSQLQACSNLLDDATRDADRYRREVRELRESLQLYEHLRTVVEGDAAEAERQLAECGGLAATQASMRELVIISVQLRRNLDRTRRDKQNLLNRCTKAENKLRYAQEELKKMRQCQTPTMHLAASGGKLVNAACQTDPSVDCWDSSQEEDSVPRSPVFRGSNSRQRVNNNNHHRAAKAPMPPPPPQRKQQPSRLSLPPTDDSTMTPVVVLDDNTDEDEDDDFTSGIALSWRPKPSAVASPTRTPLNPFRRAHSATSVVVLSQQQQRKQPLQPLPPPPPPRAVIGPTNADRVAIPSAALLACRVASTAPKSPIRPKIRQVLSRRPNGGIKLPKKLTGSAAAAAAAAAASTSGRAGGAGSIARYFSKPQSSSCSSANRGGSGDGL